MHFLRSCFISSSQGYEHHLHFSFFCFFLNCFYCCSIPVVPFPPLLLSLALPTPHLPHSIPSNCLCPQVLYIFIYSINIYIYIFIYFYTVYIYIRFSSTHKGRNSMLLGIVTILDRQCQKFFKAFVTNLNSYTSNSISLHFLQDLIVWLNPSSSSSHYDLLQMQSWLSYPNPA